MLILTTLAFAAWPLPPSSGWADVQAKPRIRCARDAQGEPWCTAELETDKAFGSVVAVIKDLERYPDTFDHVDKVVSLDTDTAWVHVDYPSPLDDREYVARFGPASEPFWPEAPVSTQSFFVRFRAVDVASAPPLTEGNIRLTRMAGGYDVWDLGNGRTKVRYTWHTDIGGELPQWISDRARLQHGTEVVTGIVTFAK